MPNIKSASKRDQLSKLQNEVNKAKKSRMKTEIKKFELKAEEGTFASKLGDKQMVIGNDGGLELLLGKALTFGPDNVADFNY